MSTRHWIWGLAATVVLGATGCDGTGDSNDSSASPTGTKNGSESSPENSGNHEGSGGELTVSVASSEAFATPAPNLSESGLELHLAGDVRFEEQFVTAPASVNSGLGPIFNEDACINCHTKDGRGRPVDAQGKPTDQIFLRISCPGEATNGGPIAVPGFGTQLQTKAVFGVAPEARLEIEYREIRGEFGDGTSYTLAEPVYTVAEPYTHFGCGLGQQPLTSPRVAPPVHGVGLLEAIPVSRLEALADPNDRDGDGISGELNRVWAIEAQETRVGRIGWKANSPSVRQQNAGAYAEDMGVTNPVMPDESAANQVQHDGLDDDAEISEAILHEATFYVQTLGVPARRNVDDPEVQRGEALFNRSIAEGGTGCASCHVPEHTTYSSEALPEPLPEIVAGQTIRPYTDLLLHDMGPDLADNRSDFKANGQEWRTPALWGIGLTETVNGHSHFLHDGRARSLTEAILWHGGEAEAAREAFRMLNVEDREAVLAFLRSL